ncbi:MAG TPA: site-2 protease family protein, partial [Candidatus Eremiobacteraceae bacterium]|nr:site-2 protease family protein [Candidatus Eremiobacteraceae bacterium]
MQITSGLKIGRILGIPIYIHTSWIFIFGFITWSLAVQYTQAHPHWSTAQHWTTGVLTSLLFFASVLFHELSHSVVAQHYKIRVISITLFLFGGVARIAREPAKPSQEFNIAIAGPLASGLLAVVFLGITLFYPYEEMTGALAFLLGWTNASLALFNLLPGFPLDGGRIFRAIVWGVTKDYSRATRIAGGSGQLVAYGMIAYGAWRAFHADLVIGGWLALLGFYLR